jgi:LPS export ABC transporter protein LptC
MMFRKLVYGLCFTVLLTTFCHAKAEEATEQSDQQISDFSLAGYGEKGKKTWDLSGKSADIFTEVVKLHDIVGNLYGKEEDVNLTAEKGDFNKVNGSVHLEQDVVITTSTGTKMTTDSLDWDRKNQLLTTNDIVNIQKENMLTIARGLKGKPNLKKIALEKEVKVDINPLIQETAAGINTKDKTTITCDGPLEIDYEKNIATFNNNVKVDRPDSVIYSDKMDVYFKQSKDKDEQDKTATLMGAKIDKIVCRGNVKVLHGENISYSEEATYLSSEKKLILTGRPKLIIYSTEGIVDASSGN